MVWLPFDGRALVLCCLFICVSSKGKPHIVVIVADDLGWSDVGFQNISTEVRTPNIDAIAREGIILTNHYVMPLCSPTRASLLTGRYPIHIGGGLNCEVISPGEDAGLPATEKILPEFLQEYGYESTLVGKWHLGFSRRRYLPTRRGFARFFGIYDGAANYFSHNQSAHTCRNANETHVSFLDFRDGERLDKEDSGVYSEFLYSEKVREVILQRDKSKSLFLLMAHQLVHSPLQVPEGFIKKPSGTYNEDRNTYLSMLSILDEAVSNLTTLLKHEGIWNDTLLLFMSDNGGQPIYSGYNWPLRGGKSTLWEGGTKSVSFLAGGFIERRGFRSDALIHVSDWLPTLLKLVDANINLPTNLDGLDIWGSIFSYPGNPYRVRDTILLNMNNVSYALRRRNWKLITEVDVGWVEPPETSWIQMNVTDRTFCPANFTEWILNTDLKRVRNGLFNLDEDPCEMHNLASSSPDIVEELQEIVNKYRKEVIRFIKGIRCMQEAINKATTCGGWCPFMDDTM